MTDSRILFIGASETAAADFPGIDLHRTQRRGEAAPADVERTFRRYLECGILAHAWHLNSMNLTTSFVLPPDDTDRLCDVAGQLMRHSPAYDSVVRDLGGTPAQAASAEQ